MTVYSGNDGVAKFGPSAAEITKVKEFKITSSANTGRTDGMGEEWEDHIVIKKGWTGSMTCYRNSSDTPGQGILLVGDTVAAEFYCDGDANGLSKLAGSVIVSGVDEGANHDAPNEISFSFTGKGALTRSLVS